MPLEQMPLRGDAFLTQQFTHLSRTHIQRSFDQGLVLRNGKALRRSERVSPGDVLEYTILLPDEPQVHAQKKTLEILYEDADLLAVNKEPGVVVHPGNGVHEPTLVSHVLWHCGSSLSRLGGKERPGVVHRLDKETSGVILFAKSDAAYLALTQAFANRSIEKTYLALVKGVPSLKAGKIEAAIGRNPNRRTQMRVQPTGRPATTFWEHAQRFGALASQLECHPQTGRTHQIRVHLNHLGHPILGDESYGYRHQPPLPRIPRVMLHAHRLCFAHPVQSDQHLDIQAPLPEDFQQCIQALSALSESGQAY